MLKITIPETEFFDEKRNKFIKIKSQTLQLEHSLVSLSKWESKWEKPFFRKGQKSVEETIDYVRCMTLTQNVNPLVYRGITNEIVDQIFKYIEKPMSAIHFKEEENSKGRNREQITSEIIYYWMISLNIPFECQKWHLNKLLTLIRVCSIKNTPPVRASTSDLIKRNRALNAARRASLNTKG